MLFIFNNLFVAFTVLYIYDEENFTLGICSVILLLLLLEKNLIFFSAKSNAKFVYDNM